MLHENYQSNAARSCYTARYAAIEFKLHAAQSDALQNAEAWDRGDSPFCGGKPGKPNAMQLLPSPNFIRNGW